MTTDSSSDDGNDDGNDDASFTMLTITTCLSSSSTPSIKESIINRSINVVSTPSALTVSAFKSASILYKASFSVEWNFPHCEFHCHRKSVTINDHRNPSSNQWLLVRWVVEMVLISASVYKIRDSVATKNIKNCHTRSTVYETDHLSSYSFHSYLIHLASIHP